MNLVLLFLLGGCFSKVAKPLLDENVEIKYEEILDVGNESNISKSISTKKEGIRIYYKSNFGRTNAYYAQNLMGNPFAEKEMENSENRVGYKEITIESNKVMVMFNDGNNNWDSIGKRKVLYIIVGKGDFVIENHQIKKIKPLKSKYNSMHIKGEFSSNEAVKMTLVEDYTWQTTLYGRTSFIFDIYGDGTAILGDNENDGIVDNDGTPINIDRNKYKVTFYEKTKTYKVEKQEITPQVVKDFSIKVLENNTISINIGNIVDKPDGVRVYKALSRDGEYKLYDEMAYTCEKWENQVWSTMKLNEIGNDEGLAYYMIKSYVGDKESEASEIIELKVGKYHNPLAKLENIKVTIDSMKNVQFLCTYDYEIKPTGIRVYKALKRDGVYKLESESKFPYTTLPFTLLCMTSLYQIGNEEGNAYYYVVPFIGDKEGEPSEIYELKVIPYHNPLAKLENFEVKLNTNGYTSISWSYSYRQKPEGIRIYKSLYREGNYSIMNETKLKQDMGPISTIEGINMLSKETGNELGYAYYYAVPFTGNKEGVPTDILEVKIK